MLEHCNRKIKIFKYFMMQIIENCVQFNDNLIELYTDVCGSVKILLIQINTHLLRANKLNYSKINNNFVLPQ